MLPALNLLAYLHFKASTGELVTPSVCKEQGGSSCWHFMGQKQSGASPGEGLHLLPPVSGFTLSNPGKYSKSEYFLGSPTLKTFSGGLSLTSPQTPQVTEQRSRAQGH